MIITISGKAGCGKSTISKFLAKHLKLKHYSIGNFMREIAKKTGVSLLELSKKAEKDKKIDKKLDELQIRLGKEQNNFVIDGRLSAFFIPHAKFKVFLDCDDRIRAKRILNALREDEKGRNVEEMLKQIKEREDSERKRYNRYYGFDYCNKNKYNCVIDTTNLSVKQVLEKLLNLIAKV